MAKRYRRERQAEKQESQNPRKKKQTLRNLRQTGCLSLDFFSGTPLTTLPSFGRTKNQKKPKKKKTTSLHKPKILNLMLESCKNQLLRQSTSRLDYQDRKSTWRQL
jgi:hypothetical protein